MGLLDSAGTKVVSYSYNAWGKLLNNTGSMAATLGVLNPFRYRGYIYDEETGFYYLRSRYYYPNRGRFINADSDFMASRSAYSYADNSSPNALDPDGADAIWITSYWYLGPVAPPFGHTSLLIEYDEKWYYTMYAQNDVTLMRLPSACMDSLDSLNEYLRLHMTKFLGNIDRTWCDYTSATYIEGDFSAACVYFKDLCEAFENDASSINKDYHLFTNNCVTVCLDLLEMSTNPDGISMKHWMEEQCNQRNIRYPSSIIPNCNTRLIAEIFGNTSYTRPQKKE